MPQSSHGLSRCQAATGFLGDASICCQCLKTSPDMLEPITTRPMTSLRATSFLLSATETTNKTRWRRCGGISNVMASLYTGFNSCFRDDVFFFLIFLPSNNRITLTNGSVDKRILCFLWAVDERTAFHSFIQAVACAHFSLTRSLTHPLTRSLADSPSDSLTHPLTRWPTPHILNSADSKCFSIFYFIVCGFGSQQVQNLNQHSCQQLPILLLI